MKTQTNNLFTHNVRAAQTRFVRSFLNLATGGDWAHRQSPATRRNLVWFWLDGMFASASDNIVNTYLVIYILTLGATQAHVGLMSSLSSMAAAMMLLPGALLVERIGRRKNIVLAGGSLARLVLMLLALLPLFAGGSALIPLAIGICLLRDMGGNLSFPAWMAMTGDIVPMEGRGRFFASRNFIMGLMGITTTFLVGILLSHTVQPGGYQVALGLAFLLGLGSLYSFGQLKDPRAFTAKQPAAPVPVQAALTDEAAVVSVPTGEAAQPSAAGLPVVQRVKGSQIGAVLAVLKEIRGHRNFAAFAGITALWNLSLNIAGLLCYLTRRPHPPYSRYCRHPVPYLGL